MSKYAAKIELGYVNEWFEGNSPCEVMRQVEKCQDFGCLLMMGRAEEGKKGQKELDKLSAFLDKYHDGSLTMEDIQNLNIHLSIADIKCHGIKELDEEMMALKF